MLDILIAILLFLVGIVLGFYLLLLGRRKLVLTTVIICLAATSGLLALVFYQERSGWFLAESRDWLLLAIAAAAGVIGGILGARAKHIAAYVIGFFAGGYIGLWFYQIAHYLVVELANWPERTAFWVGVAILVVGGFLGVLLTHRSEAVALIMISVFIGTDLIILVLNLDSSKSFTAVLALSLALLGLVVQYAQYLREIRVDSSLSPLAGPTAAAPAPEMFDLSDD